LVTPPGERLLWADFELPGVEKTFPAPKKSTWGISPCPTGATISSVNIHEITLYPSQENVYKQISITTE
jgi:hypothetical protein